MKYLLFLLLPKACFSRILGRIERMESPKWFIQRAKIWFVERYRLNMEEAEKPLEAYPSLNALFTRKLKSGQRPVRGPIIHPCDGVISQTDFLQDGYLIQAKGWKYSASELVGKPVDSEMKGGVFATYYLCPTDYHRVHFPLSGEVVGARHLVGKLWPVNEWSVNNVKNLFCVNERVVFDIQTPAGVAYMVMVGATNVGQITSPLIPELRSNATCFRSSRTYDFSASPKVVNVGGEAGWFEMGSTVIVLYPQRIAEKIALTHGSTRMGQNICRALV